MIVDSHCHLDLFTKKELPDIISRAFKNKVTTLHTICTKISQFNKILEIANINNNIYCSIGNHPLNLEEEGIICAEKIAELTKNHKVISIGETGLDYSQNQYSKRMQQESLIEHIIASQETKKPIILHVRNANHDLLHILKTQNKKKEFKGVIHCFTGDIEFALECVNLGLYLSASGIITFNKTSKIQEAFKNINKNKIIFETDAPYLAPQPFRGKKNEPSFIQYTVKRMAQILNITYQSLCEETTKNFLRLFKIT